MALSVLSASSSGGQDINMDDIEDVQDLLNNHTQVADFLHSHSVTCRFHDQEAYLFIRMFSAYYICQFLIMM